MRLRAWIKMLCRSIGCSDHDRKNRFYNSVEQLSFNTPFSYLFSPRAFPKVGSSLIWYQITKKTHDLPRQKIQVFLPLENFTSLGCYVSPQLQHLAYYIAFWLPASMLASTAILVLNWDKNVSIHNEKNPFTVSVDEGIWDITSQTKS